MGENPPAGAIIDYYLREKPKGAISMEVRDAQGALVNQFSSKPPKKKPGEDLQRKDIEEHAAQPSPPEEEETPEDDPDAPDEKLKKTELSTRVGVNRVAWDLRYKGADKVKHAKVDAGQPELGPFVNPGTYTVKLTVGGKTVTTALVVLPDPRLHVSPADLDEQLKLALSYSGRYQPAESNGRANPLDPQTARQPRRAARRQCQDCALGKPAHKLIRKLDALEEKLHNPKAEVAYDILAQKAAPSCTRNWLSCTKTPRSPVP